MGYLWSKHPDHLKKHYWSGQKKLWGGGYYAATLGDVSMDQVEKYLQKTRSLEVNLINLRDSSVTALVSPFSLVIQ